MKLEGEKRKDQISMIILYKIDEIIELLKTTQTNTLQRKEIYIFYNKGFHVFENDGMVQL